MGNESSNSKGEKSMFKNRENERVPQATVQVREGGKWVKTSTEDLFRSKTVAVFSLPGAFTPTCSSSHLPRYEELAGALSGQGVDEILCVSVNDPFVMDAWGRDQGVRNVRLVADGNGALTEAMGMLVDKSDLGFGKRSWRYSMLVRGGVIEKMFIEPETPGDPYQVSDADTMLRHLDPSASTPEIAIFTKPGCPHCARAKQLLASRGMPYVEVVVGKDVPARAVRGVSGGSTVPQVFIDGQRIGTADELEQYLAAAA
jgi:glutaredoxin-like protein